MRYHILFICAATLTVILLFFRLGQAPVERWDEQTNIEVTRELLTHPRVPLTLDGKPFLEKPPLWYWATAGLSSFTGLTVTTSRLASAVSGILIIILVGAFASEYFSKQAGLLSVLILLSTSQLYIPSSGGFFATHTLRSADADAMFVLFFTAAVIFFVAGTRKPSRNMIPGAILSALAVLTKGPMGLVPLLAYALFLLVNVPKRAAHLLLPPVLITMLLTIPWHLFMYMVTGNEFIKTYAGYHLLLRFTSGLEGHANPWWYYLNVIKSIYVFPAFPAVAASLLVLAARKIPVRVNPELFIPLTSFFIYLVIIFLAKTRLAWYLLPAYPLTAMVSGWWLRNPDTRTGKLFPLMIAYLLVFAVRNVFLLP